MAHLMSLPGRLHCPRSQLQEFVEARPPFPYYNYRSSIGKHGPKALPFSILIKLERNTIAQDLPPCSVDPIPPRCEAQVHRQRPNLSSHLLMCSIEADGDESAMNRR